MSLTVSGLKGIFVTVHHKMSLSILFEDIELFICRESPENKLSDGVRIMKM